MYLSANSLDLEKRPNHSASYPAPSCLLQVFSSLLARCSVKIMCICQQTAWIWKRGQITRRLIQPAPSCLLLVFSSLLARLVGADTLYVTSIVRHWCLLEKLRGGEGLSLLCESSYKQTSLMHGQMIYCTTHSCKVSLLCESSYEQTSLMHGQMIYCTTHSWPSMARVAFVKKGVFFKTGNPN